MTTTRAQRILVVLAAAVLVGAAGVGVVLAQGGMMGPRGGYGGPGAPGMHPGYGGQGAYGYGPYGYGMGGGMMGGYGGGMMMGGGMMGGGMMGMAMGPLPADAAPMALPDLEARLRSVLSQFPAGAEIRDVMPFTNNVYAQVVDADGNGLAELLADRFSGVVTPEPGPNMMWNQGAAGGYGGMMGGYGGGMMYGQVAPGAQPRFDLDAAKAVADRFLAGYADGATVMESQGFPGYYTFDYGKDAVEGMLSVNAYTGAVWPHTWHGAFLGEEP